MLLCFLIFLISYIQSYFPPERSKKILGRFHGIWANVIAALLGTVTPFCSCSSIPLFIGFTSAGLPLGVTFSFLISSPMVDLGSLLLLVSIFGWKIAVAYVIVGLIVAVIGGTLIQNLHMEKYVEDFIKNASAVDIDSPTLSQKERLIYAKDQMLSTFKKVLPVYSCWCGYRSGHSQLDSRSMGGGRSRQQQSIWCNSRNAYWCTDVCRYFWHHSRGRGFTVQRCTAWYNSFIYDGGHYAVSSVYDYAEKGDQAEAVGTIYRYLRSGYYHCRLFVQCVPLFTDIGGNQNGIIR